ncbi:class I SAM-dependent DNA methyltransferase [Cryobacterium sp. PH31-L1]|uniref:type I restriction-modification system subunit M n=1 Tax=Cryobacterium sp. PH31-L1 TaxID=3046199 RepID=UPI0024BA5C85|nr:class I SAM-dependent DNA methyltransferase [Cryobacterium sp. PH31-L1]MDJ0379083.1 class I SAM-dependent DNA methyltransferase [Cryobacterium sp. PH31-L1]
MTLVSTQPAHLTQRQLEGALWDAANALRGPVDPADFKSYVFPVLFFKWISDTWDYNHARALVEFGSDLDDEIESDFHIFQIPTGCHWHDVYNTVENVGDMLAGTLLSVQEANPGSLDGVFGDVNWANTERLPETALVALLRAFDQLQLDAATVTGDMLGSAYEYLLREFAEASGKKAGEFFTPRHVVHLIVKLLSPKPGESIADPACGSGGMLVETVAAVDAAGGDSRTLRLYGQEINLTTSAIAKMNLYLHGVEDFTIVRGDTFREPKLLDGDELRHFDLVIANPPFSLKNWGADVWAGDRFGRAIGEVPPATNADFAWIQHMVKTMKPDTGRVGVVMPHGVLFRGGKEARIREELLRSDQLEAVIGLPSNLFYSTSIPVCILVFRAHKPAERVGRVLFVDASARFTPSKNQNVMSDSDIETIAAAYQAGDDIDGVGGLHLRLVDHDEIKHNGYDLNIGRYIKSETVAEANVEEAIILMREAQQRLADAQAALDERLRAAGFDA